MKDEFVCDVQLWSFLFVFIISTADKLKLCAKRNISVNLSLLLIYTIIVILDVETS